MKKANYLPWRNNGPAYAILTQLLGQCVGQDTFYSTFEIAHTFLFTVMYRHVITANMMWYTSSLSLVNEVIILVMTMTYA